MTKIKSIEVFQKDLPIKEGKYSWSHGNSVSVFDSTKKAKECYHSKEYQHARSFLNDDIADRIIHIVEGLD